MKTNLLFFICILFALVSCEQEDKVSGEKTLAVVSASSDDRPSTRGIINDNTYALGVFRTTANTYAPLFNVKHIYSGGEWGADDVIKVDYRNASFFAYYPYHTATGNYAGLAGGTTLTCKHSYSMPERIFAMEQVKPRVEVRLVYTIRLLSF